MGRSFRVAQANNASDVAAVRQLFLAYQRSLDVDLCFQGFAEELACLPGPYTPPKGALLIARDELGLAVGCVALKPLDENGVCEMKRLFLLPEVRGNGLGRRLVDAVLDAARLAGHSEIRLDSLPSMDKAVALYSAAGFDDIEPYYSTPIKGTRFLGRAL